MKKPKRIFYALIAVILTLNLVFPNISAVGEDDKNEKPIVTSQTKETDSPDYQLIKQDGKIELYADLDSNKFIGTFKIVNTVTGYEWISSPETVEEDKLVKGKDKMALYSNVVVGYGNPDKNRTDTIPSRSGSVNKKAAKAEKMDGGVKITYDFPEEKLTVPIMVKLEKGSLKVNVDFENVREYGENLIYSLNLLPAFGAVGNKAVTETAGDGYVFVPDGSGALMRFDNGKSLYKPYSESVYGPDYTNSALQRQEVKQIIRLPVFGIKNHQDAFLSVVEEGDGIATIEAAVSGNKNNYNTVSTSYNVRAIDVYRFGSETSSLSQSSRVFSKGEITDRKISLRYYFMENENASYSGMAQQYQKHLMTQNDWEIRVPESLPFHLQVLGGVIKESNILGFPKNKIQSMTAYDEAKDMVNLLSQEGIGNIKLRYINFSSDTIWRKPSDDVGLPAQLGGNSRFQSLLKDTDANIYPDTDYSWVEKWNGLDNAYFGSAKTISSTNATMPFYDIPTFYRNSKSDNRFLLSLDRITKYSESFIKTYEKKYSNYFVSLGSLGESLHSDYSSASNSRQDTLDRYKRIAEEWHKKGFDLMVSGGNAFMLGGASQVLNSPDDSHYDMFDESVPFYQMVLNGYVGYSTPAWNLSENPRKSFLYAVEVGAYQNYYVYAQETEKLKGTDFSGVFNGNINSWLSDIKTQYQALSDIYVQTKGSHMINHESLQDKVNATTYSNGVVVVVNYNKEQVETKYGTVEPENYAIAKGGN